MEVLPDFNLNKNDYDLQKLDFLGQGGYGKVYKSRNLKTNQYVAIKQINMQKINQEGLAHGLKQQISIMKQLKSDNIVQLIDYCIGKDYTYMVLEICDSDLRKAMQSRKQKYSEQACINIFGQVMKGFKVLIQKSCIHRDVKPQNILIQNNSYKLADFGFACKADMFCKQKIQDICGTPIYMAPQLLRKEPYTAKCDIWSLGLMLYELLYGYTPWPMKCPQSYLQSIQKRSLSFPFGVKIGKQTKDFLRKSLVEDQERRMSWQQLFKHPLIANKLMGQAQQQKQISPKIRRLLSGIQREVERKRVDQIDIFKKYQQLDTLDENQFSELMKQLNPTITTNQISLLFQACDANHNNVIDREEFKTLFCTVDYRSDPETQKQINEIIGIILARDVQIEDLFVENDFNKTGALDSKEFQSLVRSIAPKYSKHLIQKLYKKFDSNHDGLISKNQFLQIFAKGLVNQKNYVGLWGERAERNLRNLKICLHDKQLSFKEVMKMADLNSDQHIDRSQFTKLLQQTNFKISEQQVDQIFKLIDQNNSNKISLLELETFMK